MKVDYSKGKIYKITNDYNNDIYVGSTCDTLAKRFSTHKKDAHMEKSKDRPLYKLINEIGFSRFRIELIENYPSEDKYQLLQREGYYIRALSTLNMNIAGRTMKEWVVDNTEKIKEDQKKYRIKNKDARKEYCKENINKINENKKKSYYKNKESINEKRRSIKVMCCCGCEIREDGMSEHQLTKKHINIMNSRNLQDGIPITSED